MRRIAVALCIVIIGLLSAARVAGGDRPVTTGRLSVRVPVGWHVLGGWLSDVVDPVPALAVASFQARLSRHTCECGLPNVLRFPRDGAFVFVWEYPHPSRRMLAHTPPRPAHFDVAGQGEVRHTCFGPSDGFVLESADRILQVDVYLGPAVSRALRGRLAAVLDSLGVARHT